MKRLLFLFVLSLFFSCKQDVKKVGEEKMVDEPTVPKKEIEVLTPLPNKKDSLVSIKGKEKVTLSPLPKKKETLDLKKKDASYFDDEFTQLDANKGLVIDIKYATKDNFTKKVIYPCGKCYLRPLAATAIFKANTILKEKYGYKLKMFDCYRPRPAQQRLWDVVPNPDYVTPPAKGSMHNKGLAVDLTIVDKNGKELDMGTPYDFFGEKAHTDNLTLPKNVLENRTILKDVMKSVGFDGIRTEWWHFSYKTTAGLSSWEWACN
jgi:zinc D-Ala-D-Ala dipeptidase